jgi:hypothetical protein
VLDISYWTLFDFVLIILALRADAQIGRSSSSGDYSIRSAYDAHSGRGTVYDRLHIAAHVISRPAAAIDHTAAANVFLFYVIFSFIIAECNL